MGEDLSAKSETKTLGTNTPAPKIWNQKLGPNSRTKSGPRVEPKARPEIQRTICAPKSEPQNLRPKILAQNLHSRFGPLAPGTLALWDQGLGPWETKDQD